MQDRTTELIDMQLAIARGRDPNFSWGRLVELSAIGKYTVGKYYPWSPASQRVSYEQTPLWHGWVNGLDAHVSWPTLETAIIGLIVFDKEGSNSQAGIYIAKMLGLTIINNSNKINL
jgi:hypothetical protein